MLEWKEIEKILDHIWDGKTDSREEEGQFLEFKEQETEEKKLIEKLAEYAVCFANSEGGTVVIGVRDKSSGAIAFPGCTKEVDIPKIVESIHSKTSNPIRTEISYHDYRGVKLLEIKVPKGLYKYGHALTSGARYERIGRSCQPVLPHSEPHLKTGVEFDPFMAAAENVTLKDMDRSTIDSVKELLRARPAYQGFLSMNQEDFVCSLGMAKRDENDELRITIAGALFAGSDSLVRDMFPQSRVLFQDQRQHDGLGSGSDFGGNAFKLVNWVGNLLSQYNESHYIDTGLFEELKIETLPLDVVREAILNAVIHRDYSLGSPTMTYVSSEGVILQNPGGFIGGISPGNIRTHSPVSRQLSFSNLFERIGMVRERGDGVDMIYRSLITSGKEPPHYADDGNQVRLVLTNRIDEKLAKLLYEMKAKDQHLTLEEMIVLSVLKDAKTIDIKQAAQALQYSDMETQVKLDRMCNEPSRLLSQVSTQGKRFYRLSDRIWKMLGDELGYYRNGEIAVGQWKSRVMDVVNSKGCITSGQCQRLLSITRAKAYRLLSQMEEEEQLKMTGATKGAKYVKWDRNGTSGD
jgi:ATP-dependent DNA helicase RecG